MSAPRLLVLDTATEVMHLGLLLGEELHSVEAEGGARASAELLPGILKLLADAGIALRELDAIAFGQGPGAFTGLRTACSVAQGLAYGAGRPVIALDTLLAVAEHARIQGAGPQLWALNDARMGEIYAARYAYSAGRWQTLAAAALYSPAALMERLRDEAPEVALAGNALSAHAEALSGMRRPCWPEARPCAAALAALARAAWARDDILPAEQALPVYVRDKVAQTTAEREAARGVAS
ncbi:MAG TPA: tRNA (adenosine(37)-N6)-threonylcarbamoyltransferase complex dimerization subunit type 1 TsaB [Methylibium sp.]